MTRIYKHSFFHCNHHYTAARCPLRNALHTLVPTAMYLGPFQVFFTISPALTNLLDNLVIWTLMTNVYIHLQFRVLYDRPKIYEVVQQEVGKQWDPCIILYKGPLAAASPLLKVRWREKLCRGKLKSSFQITHDYKFFIEAQLIKTGSVFRS